MGYGNTTNLKVETKEFQQKINQYHTIQLTIKKELYDKIYKVSRSFNLKIDDLIIICTLMSIDYKYAFDYVKDLDYKIKTERIVNWMTSYLD